MRDNDGTKTIRRDSPGSVSNFWKVNLDGVKSFKKLRFRVVEAIKVEKNRERKEFARDSTRVRWTESLL